MSDQPPKLFRIARWKELHECAQNRKAVGIEMHWIKQSNRTDTEIYQFTIAQPDGRDLFWAWEIMKYVASRSKAVEERGVLARPDGSPHDADTLAMLSGSYSPETVEIFRRALGWFSSAPLCALVEVRRKPAAAPDQLELAMGPTGVIDGGGGAGDGAEEPGGDIHKQALESFYAAHGKTKKAQ